jgi:hypothetical protein
MDGEARRTRFEERVRIERDFLVPVNQRFGATAPLAGMTEAAIMSWQRRVAPVSQGVDVVRVASLLLEAAKRAELLADNSRDVFEKGRNVGPDGLAAIRGMLHEVLESATA